MEKMRPTAIATGSARRVPWKPSHLRMCEKHSVCMTSVSTPTIILSIAKKSYRSSSDANAAETAAARSYHTPETKKVISSVCPVMARKKGVDARIAKPPNMDSNQPAGCCEAPEPSPPLSPAVRTSPAAVPPPWIGTP